MRPFAQELVASPRCVEARGGTPCDSARWQGVSGPFPGWIPPDSNPLEILGNPPKIQTFLFLMVAKGLTPKKLPPAGLVIHPDFCVIHLKKFLGKGLRCMGDRIGVWVPECVCDGVKFFWGRTRVFAAY